MTVFRQLCVALLVILAGSGRTLAAADQGQPINIQSDHARYEASHGVYTGNVVMQQGPLRIEADKIIIFGVDKKVERLQSFGKPASFFHRNADGSITRASADSIEYRIAQEQVVLEHNASIQHQGSELHGERIVYHSGQQTVDAQGSSESGERVQMILQPQTATAPTENPEQDSSDDNARTESP